MDEQRVDQRRTSPKPGDNAAGNLLREDAPEAPGVPLVGNHDRTSAGTAGAGPMQGAATRERVDVGRGGLSGRVESGSAGMGSEDETGYIGSGRDGGPGEVLSGDTRSGYGGTGRADPAGNRKHPADRGTGDRGGAGIDDANTPSSGALPDEEVEDDADHDRRITPPTS